MVEKKEFSFLSADGITRIRALNWIPDKDVKVRGILILVHGMQEFIDRYDDFALFLASNGYIVYGHDMLGHGASIRNGDERYFGYFGKNSCPGDPQAAFSPSLKGGADSSEPVRASGKSHGKNAAQKDDRSEICGRDILIRDIRQLQSLALDSHPSLPCFLFGHSMGSFLARAYLCVYGSGLNGAVICGTAWHPQAEAAAGMLLSRLIAKRYGWFYRSPLLNKLALGSCNKQFEPARTPVDWLTRDENIVDRYIADRRTQFTFTCNGFYTLFSTLSYLTKTANLKRMPQKLPVLFIAGAQDSVGSNGEGPKKTAVQFQSLGMKKISCKIYPQCRHELLNELNKDEVFQDVLNFLNSL